MTPGRNDPCPCGSGKKYKKCCLGTASQTPGPTGPEVIEARLLSTICSYYTPAAIAEALKPGGMVQIHPYAAIKLRGDPRLLETVLPEARARLLQLWRPSRVAAMPVEEIGARLILMGVPFDRAAFIELAKPRYSAWEIADEWGRSFSMLSRADKDFLGLAACELWRRLCKDRPSLEMIDDWLCEGYALVNQTNRTEGLEAWWRMWETLRPRLTPEIKNLQEAGDRLFPNMSQCLSNWGTDFRLEALNGSIDDARCGEVGVRFILELLEALPGESEDLHWHGDLAMIYFHLHREAEAEQRCQDLMRDYPDRAIGYISLSQALHHSATRGVPDPARLRRAIQLLEQALAYPVKDADDFDIAGRLADVRGSLSKATTS